MSPGRTGVTCRLLSPGGIPKKYLRQDASWAGITVTEEVTALTPGLYLGREVNSVFLAGLGQQWSQAGKQGRGQLERSVGARQLLYGA